jgi:hypothetical protein
MHDPIDPASFREQLGDSLAIGDIEAPKGEAGPALEPGQPIFLQGDLVVVVQVVDADNGFAAAEERLGNVIADKAGDPSYQYGHPFALLSAGRPE